MDFPNSPDAQAWITQSVAYMDYEIGVSFSNSGVEFLDGYAREQPRYHTWELLQLSNYLAVLKRRCAVDRYDNPVLKQALDWYARYATPPVSIAGNQPVTPAWGDSTYSELGGPAGAPTEAVQLKNFYVPALFAPAYQQRDPFFSQRLMYWWRRGGSPDYTQQAFSLTNPQLLDRAAAGQPAGAAGQPLCAHARRDDPPRRLGDRRRDDRHFHLRQRRPLARKRRQRPHRSLRLRRAARARLGVRAVRSGPDGVDLEQSHLRA